MIPLPNFNFKPRNYRLYRAEGRALLSLAGPIFTSLLAQQSLAFVDTVMAGRVSAVDLAGVAVGGSLWIPLLLFLYGLLLAVTPMVAHLYGAGRTAECGPLARRALWVALPVVLLSIFLLRHADRVFVLMGVEAEVVVIAVDYLKAMTWGLPAVAIFFVLRNLSEGLGLARPSMLIGLASVPVNILFNYIFIYGNFGSPRLGGVGCGWGSAVTLWFMCGCILLVIRRVGAYTPTHFFDLSRKHGEEGARQIFRLGLPIGASLLVESSAFALIALFLAPLGAVVVSAHQITLNYSSLIFMIPLSLSSAMTIRVGHAVGQGRLDRARLVSRTGLGLTSLIALLTSAFTLLCASLVAGLYTRNAQLVVAVVSLLSLNALYQLPDALQVGAAASLRGYKDTRLPLLLVVVSYWVISLPLGYSLALTNLWGPPLGARGFWISLIAGLSLAAVLLGMRLKLVEGHKD